LQKWDDAIWQLNLNFKIRPEIGVYVSEL